MLAGLAKPMELTCKVRHRVWNEQWVNAILAGHPKKADLPGAIELNKKCKLK